MNSLMWFRRDLRLADNRALLEACDYAKHQSAKVYAIFISTPKQWFAHDIAAIQIDFIERHLHLLANSLAQLGIELRVIQGDDFSSLHQLVTDFCHNHNISAVFASSEPEYDERQRDNKVKQMCQKQHIAFNLFDDHCLIPPGSVLNQAGNMFKVFTPFSKKWRGQLTEQMIIPLAPPKAVGAPLKPIKNINLNYSKVKSDNWLVGEQETQKILNHFINEKVADYDNNRDFPAIDGTSSLSPYLAIGVLSPKQCVAALLTQFPQALTDKTSGCWTWLTEICWREFYRHLLVAFPQLCKGKNFNPLADNVNWLNNKKDFQHWCQGTTGYPIVDAAMRQLNQTGWMHNRLRMITASFLVKHLLIDWRLGEQYFKQKLIDGDLAANNGGWQWAAGTGCDAQPYFRIFNPMTQSEKFDPLAKFIIHYVPELKNISAKNIHNWPKNIKLLALFDDISTNEPCKKLDHNNIYAHAIIEHKFARERALNAFSVMKKSL